ncbi:unnamed protein product [Orchesella dallaii]|uniref:Uncharacterized protein n=1 Tax=Orchesella dallaii TaxID=48710 RepID=A0ABP1PUU3_9HEXA
MLTKLQKLACKLHEGLTFYMYPFPLKWDTNYIKLTLNAPTYKLLPWIISSTLVILIWFAHVFTLIWYGLAQPRKDFGTVNVVILLITTAASFGVIVVALISIWNGHATLTGMKEGLEFGQDVYKLMVFPKLAKVCDDHATMIELHQRYVQELFTNGKRRHREGLRDIKRARSMVPMKFRYGGFYWIGKDFMVEYFTLMLLRSFDAVLILDY